MKEEWSINQKEGTVQSLGSSRKGNHAKGTPRWDACQGIGHHTQTPFLNPGSLPPMVWYQKCSHGKGLHGES